MRFFFSKSFLILSSLLYTCLLIAIHNYMNTLSTNLQVNHSDRSVFEEITTERVCTVVEIKFDRYIDDVPCKLCDSIIGYCSIELNTIEKCSNFTLQLKVWPEDDLNSDRIVDQIAFAEMFAKQNKKRLQTKKIYLNDQWNYISDNFDSFFEGCPVSECQVTQSEQSDVDAYLFREVIPFTRYFGAKTQHQIWIYYSLESPYSYEIYEGVDFINWTATYRLDSDIPTPYGKYVRKLLNDSKVAKKVNYAKGKSKKVAWFVSNCGANNNRLEFARELRRYINVDIYGSCGRKKCSREESSECFERLKNDYKFYLSFENCNCKDYITEKFFVNALQNNVVPIVMGAHKEDYSKLAPPHSFIHVNDFDSVESLATYLLALDRNDQLYNSYFEWKETGEFIDTKFWCRLCALLHSNYKSKHYTDLRKWWQSGDVCSGNQRRL